MALLSLCIAASALGDIQKFFDGAKGADGSNRDCHGALTVSK